MLRGIGTPRPPRFRPRKQLERRRHSSVDPRDRPLQRDVVNWKGVGLTQFTHRDVLCCPFADPGQRREALHTIRQAPAGAEDVRVIRDGRREG
jgi:hypothetical protein